MAKNKDQMTPFAVVNYNKKEEKETLKAVAAAAQYAVDMSGTQIDMTDEEGDLVGSFSPISPEGQVQLATHDRRGTGQSIAPGQNISDDQWERIFGQTGFRGNNDRIH